MGPSRYESRRKMESKKQMFPACAPLGMAAARPSHLAYHNDAAQVRVQRAESEAAAHGEHGR